LKTKELAEDCIAALLGKFDKQAYKEDAEQRNSASCHPTNPDLVYQLFLRLGSV